MLICTEHVELAYKVRVDAKIKKESKTILHQQEGVIESRSFTAVLGPSGSGKTTLLNFLSGRLMSDNLELTGEYYINSVRVRSIEPYSSQVGYVMQEDALLATLTPKECFRFAADLRLPGKTKLEKDRIVDNLIEELGLQKCMDTKIGNVLIKGISGGEKKRTSIGVELVTNPKLIFLDEPTTGLDSTTALQVILLLKKLANAGRTVISTIHQPSSELFCEFDRLMLLVSGRCIYHGVADAAEPFFAEQGYRCPPLMNAAEFYLDLMSLDTAEAEEEGMEDLKKKHEEQILSFEGKFKSSQEKLESLMNGGLLPLARNSAERVGLIMQIWLILKRSLLTQLRNPMDVFFKSVQSVFTAVIVIIVFSRFKAGSPKPEEELQNLKGVLFFLVSTNAFGGMQGTLATFSGERGVFLRERYSKSYSTASYFLTRTAANFPFELIYPTVGLTIVYWAVDPGNGTATQFLEMVLIVNAIYFCCASFGLLYAALIPKLETAMALVPVLIIPFMLLGGFFVSLDGVSDIRVIFYPIMYLSPFRYGFQALMVAADGPIVDPKPATYAQNVAVLLGIGVGIRIFSCIAMQLVSNPKRPKLKASKGSPE